MEEIVLPILERDVLDELDPDEVAAEQARQRTKMQVKSKYTPGNSIISSAIGPCAAACKYLFRSLLPFWDASRPLVSFRLQEICKGSVVPGFGKERRG